MGRARIWEDEVVGLVVVLDARAIVVWINLSEGTGGAERDERNIDDVIAETSAVRRADAHEAAILEGILRRALEPVAAEHAEAIEALTAGQSRRRRGQVDLDQVGNED